MGERKSKWRRRPEAVAAVTIGQGRAVLPPTSHWGARSGTTGLTGLPNSAELRARLSARLCERPGAISVRESAMQAVDKAFGGYDGAYGAYGAGNGYDDGYGGDVVPYGQGPGHNGSQGAKRHAGDIAADPQGPPAAERRQQCPRPGDGDEQPAHGHWNGQ